MNWRTLTRSDLDTLLTLQQACYAADGYDAIPLEWDFEQAISDSVATRCATLEGQLFAAAWIRQSDDIFHLRMLAHPNYRDLRASLLEWAEGGARERQSSTLRIHDQAVTDSADALYTSHGFRRIFAEDVMRCVTLIKAQPLPEEITLRTWSAETAPQFYAAYTNAFRTRPGYSPHPHADWIADHQDDPDFRPDLSYVAIQDGEPLGFVVSVISTTRNVWGERSGWIDQVGVIPAARGKGLASDLIFRVMNGMSDVDHILLHVNVNNPNALRLYQHLGFTIAGRRARYEK